MQKGSRISLLLRGENGNDFGRTHIEMNPVRQIAFGYSTQCNIRCGHCVAADASPAIAKMDFDRAKKILREMARSHVTGISFTAGEPLLFFDDICRLIQLCRENGIYSRVVTNGFWAKTQEHSDRVVSEVMSHGLSQLRLSFSRWHQQHINRDNILRAALSCQKKGLDYFISFVTDFSEKDDSFEQFLRHHHLKYFPEPVIYFGRAGEFHRQRIFTDYQPNVCTMNPYLSPELDMYACCDAANRFSKTDFLYLGNLRNNSIDTLFRKGETHILYHLIRTMGLTNMASYLGFKAREIVQYRKCELCEKLFNSKENLSILTESANSDLIHWRR
ncbi:MAG: radical SAM protein [Deltaproteobacteria bacterium]|nr:MAG: radical SAM protein [Deltaproteobacteria bacterium]